MSIVVIVAIVCDTQFVCVSNIVIVDISSTSQWGNQMGNSMGNPMDNLMGNRRSRRTAGVANGLESF